MPEKNQKRDTRSYADRAKILRFYAASRRRFQRIVAVKYKGKSCTKCGYDKSASAMEFHHRDPSTKKFSVSVRAFDMPWIKVRQEIDKCDMVCANCHREIHDKMLYNKQS